jgi:uncharacterized protein (TIGR01777 family)
MKILITGATGLVGQHLIVHLLEEGHEINFLTSRKEAVNSIANCKGFYWDISNQAIDVSCIDGVTKIIHLAGASISKRWTTQYKKEIISSRVKSSELLYQTLKENKHIVTQFVCASAVGIYKDSLFNCYEENSKELSEGFLGEVVQKWEQSVTVFSKLNIRVTKIRVGVVLAKNGGALQQMKQPIIYGFGAPFASGKQYVSWIHIHDLVKLFSFLVEKDEAGVYNAVSPDPVTNSELTSSIAQQLKRPLFLPNIPKFVLKLMLGEMHQIVCDSQKVSSQKIKKLGFNFQYKNIESALSNLLK